MDFTKALSLWLSKGDTVSPEAKNVRPAISMRDEGNRTVATLTVQTPEGPKSWSAAVLKSEAEAMRQIVHDWVHGKNAKALAKVPPSARAQMMGDNGETIDPFAAKKVIPKTTATYDQKAKVDLPDGRKLRGKVEKKPYDPDELLTPEWVKKTSRGKVEKRPHDPDELLTPDWIKKPPQGKARGSVPPSDELLTPKWASSGDTITILGHDAITSITKSHVRGLAIDRLRKTAPEGLLGAVARKEMKKRSATMGNGFDRLTPLDTQPGEPRDALYDFDYDATFVDDSVHEDEMAKKMNQNTEAINKTLQDQMYGDDVVVGVDLEGALVGRKEAAGAEPIKQDGRAVGWKLDRNRVAKRVRGSTGTVPKKFVPERDAEKLALVKKLDKTLTLRRAKYLAFQKGDAKPTPVQLEAAKDWTRELLRKHDLPLPESAVGEASFSALPQGVYWDPKKGALPGTNPATGRYDAQHPEPGQPAPMLTQYQRREAPLQQYPGRGPRFSPGYRPRYMPSPHYPLVRPGMSPIPTTLPSMTSSPYFKLPPGPRPTATIFAALHAWHGANKGDAELRREVLGAKRDERRGVPLARQRMDELRSARRWWWQRTRRSSLTARRPLAVGLPRAPGLAKLSARSGVVAHPMTTARPLTTAMIGSSGKVDPRTGPIPAEAFGSLQDWTLDALIRTRAGEKAAWVSVNSVANRPEVAKAIAEATARLAKQTPGKTWKSPNGYAYRLSPDGNWVRMPGPPAPGSGPQSSSSSMGLSAVYLDPRSWFWWSKEEVELRKKLHEQRQRNKQLEKITPIAEQTVAMRNKAAEMEKVVQEAKGGSPGSASSGAWSSTAPTVLGVWWNPISWFEKKSAAVMKDAEAEAPVKLPVMPGAAERIDIDIDVEDGDGQYEEESDYDESSGLAQEFGKAQQIIKSLATPKPALSHLTALSPGAAEIEKTVRAQKQIDLSQNQARSKAPGGSATAQPTNKRPGKPAGKAPTTNEPGAQHEEEEGDIVMGHSEIGFGFGDLIKWPMKGLERAITGTYYGFKGAGKGVYTGVRYGTDEPLSKKQKAEKARKARLAASKKRLEASRQRRMEAAAKRAERMAEQRALQAERAEEAEAARAEQEAQAAEAAQYDAEAADASADASDIDPGDGDMSGMGADEISNRLAKLHPFAKSQIGAAAKLAASKTPQGAQVRAGRKIARAARKGSPAARQAIRQIDAKAKAGNPQAKRDKAAIHLGNKADIELRNARKVDVAAKRKDAHQKRLASRNKHRELLAIYERGTRAKIAPRDPNARRLANAVTMQKQIARGNKKAERDARIIRAAAQSGNPQAKRAVGNLAVASAIVSQTKTPADRVRFAASYKMYQQAQKPGRRGDKARQQLKLVYDAATAGDPDAKRAIETMKVAVAADIASKGKKHRAFRARRQAQSPMKFAPMVVTLPKGAQGARPLQIGTRGPLVTVLQSRLKNAGYDPGRVDGRFGPKTQEALKRFQAAQHLAPTGIATEGVQVMLASVSETSDTRRLEQRQRALIAAQQPRRDGRVAANIPSHPRMIAAPIPSSPRLIAAPIPSRPRLIAAPIPSYALAGAVAVPTAIVAKLSPQPGTLNVKELPAPAQKVVLAASQDPEARQQLMSTVDKVWAASEGNPAAKADIASAMKNPDTAATVAAATGIAAAQQTRVKAGGGQGPIQLANVPASAVPATARASADEGMPAGGPGPSAPSYTGPGDAGPGTGPGVPGGPGPSPQAVTAAVAAVPGAAALVKSFDSGSPEAKEKLVEAAKVYKAAQAGNPAAKEIMQQAQKDAREGNPQAKAALASMTAAIYVIHVHHGRAKAKQLEAKMPSQAALAQMPDEQFGRWYTGPFSTYRNAVRMGGI